MSRSAADLGSTGTSQTVRTTATLAGARKGKKKWRVADPAQIAPHYYHADLFRANFPLVKVVEIPAGYPFPVRDKFEGVVLDAKATCKARREWIRRFFNVSSTFRPPENEKQTFPVHFSFLEPLKELTRPSRDEVAKQNEYSGMKRKWDYEEVQKVGRPKKTTKRQAEDFAGLYLVPDVEEVADPLGFGGDYELSVEGAAKLEVDIQGDEDIPTGFADGIVHIFDEKPDKLNPDLVAAVVERKFAEDSSKWRARFQGGFYAAKHGLENLQKGHGSPIYVVVMTASTWSYGILVPEGYVDIRKGSVRHSCMAEFERHQQLTGVKFHDYESLQAQLKVGTEFYQRSFKEEPDAVYRDGPMLAGNFYLCSKWFDLPRDVKAGAFSAGGRRLFDGLLRLVLGDCVMDLTGDELDERMNLRRQMIDERIDSWFSTDDD